MTLQEAGYSSSSTVRCFQREPLPPEGGVPAGNGTPPLGGSAVGAPQLVLATAANECYLDSSGSRVIIPQASYMWDPKAFALGRSTVCRVNGAFLLLPHKCGVPPRLLGTPRLRGSPVPLRRQALIFIAEPCAGPSPRLPLPHQTRLYWIVLRVTNRPFQMLPITDEGVEILPFPESSAAI